MANHLPLYNRKEWLLARKRALHAAGYRCTRCGAELHARDRTAHVHHRKAAKRAPALQLEPLNLIALCRTCHTITECDERAHGVDRGCDERGMPISPAHPWNADAGGD